MDFLTQPDFTLQISRKSAMSTGNQEPNVTVRDIACSRPVEKKSAGKEGKMGNFHFNKLFEYRSSYSKL